MITENTDHKKNARHEEYSIFTNIIITAALTRNLIRDLKEYIHENTPEHIKKITDPTTRNMRNTYARLFENNFPRLSRFTKSNQAKFFGFPLSIIAFSIHDGHLAHQYSEMGNSLHNGIEKLASNANAKPSDLNEAEIAEKVCATNCPFI